MIAIENAGTLWIWPKPAANLTNGLRLRYQARPPSLFLTKVNDGSPDETVTINPPGHANFAGALEFRGQSYNELKVYVSAGTAVGEQAEIVSVNAAGTLMTLDEAISGLANGDTLEVVSPLPPSAMPALIARAAWYWAKEERAPDRAQEFGADYNEAMNHPNMGLKNLIKKRQTAAPMRKRRVR
jgi:hypothetical protein